MHNRVAYKESVRRKPGLWYLDRIEQAALDTAPALFDGTLVVTSANDSTHGPGSLHGDDKALDIRTLGKRTGGINLGEGHAGNWVTYVEGQQDAAWDWVDRLQAKLGDDFDVVWEHNHLHVEYQPK